MFTRLLSLVGFAAFIAAAAATPAMAGSCCGTCAYACAPPAPIQIWGLVPSHGVNQGPVYTGPGYYTSPTYETEVSTADYPYSGSSDFYDAGPYADPFRNDLYHPYWPMLPGRLHHLGRLYPRETGAIYRHGFGRRAMVMSVAEQPVSHAGREIRDPRDR